MNAWENDHKRVRFSILLFLTALTSCAEPRSVQGLYVYGHEVEEFHPCGDTATYWFVAPTHRSSWLRAKHDSLTNRPYEPVFIDVVGAISDERTDGFAEAYAAYWKADSIISVRTATARDCRMAEFTR